MDDLVFSGWTLLALFAAGLVYAGEGLEQKRDRLGPPPVAIEACAAAVDGDNCSFEGRQGEALVGECITDRDNVLACRPEHQPPRLKRRSRKEPGNSTDE